MPGPNPARDDGTRLLGPSVTATSSSARRPSSTAARTSIRAVPTARTSSSSCTCSRRTSSRAGRAREGPGAGHSLTLDGQGETDYYTIWTLGSHGDPRNYVINILDTGAPNDGVDEAAIYGWDEPTDQFNGYEPGHARQAATDDIFLLRATKCIDTQAPYGARRDDGRPTTCDTPTESAAQSGLRRAAPRRQLARRRAQWIPQPRRRRRGVEPRPAHQLRRCAQRPAVGVRPRRQRLLRRRRQRRDHHARRRRRLRHLPDRPDLRPQARRGRTAACCRPTRSRCSSRRPAAG